MVVAMVALVVIGPKDLPNVMRTVGNWVGRARGMARHFRSGIDTMIREAELEEMEKKWKAENERIMREHPMLPHDPTMLPEHPLPPEPYGEQDAPAPAPYVEQDAPAPEAPAAPTRPEQERRELP